MANMDTVLGQSADAPARNVEQRIAAWAERMSSKGTLHAPYTFELSITVSVLLLLLHSPDYWYVEMPASLLCIAALLHRPAAERAHLWMLMASVLAAGLLLHWYSADNHKYLIMYWSLALTCAFASKDPPRVLRITAHLLVGLCFAFAVGWKLWSGDFRDGTFMQFCLLTDDRFAGVTRWLTGVPYDVLAGNDEALGTMMAWDGRGDSVQLQGLPQVALLGQALTWWTYFIEGWVAVAFLAPRRTWLSRWRDVPLILFVISTYSIATVAGFATVLIAMGLAQCRRRPVWIPLGYVAALFLLHCYMAPWSRLLEAAVH